MRGSRGGGGGRGVRTTLENHKTIKFLSNTGPDPLEDHKATKPGFNVGPTSTRINSNHLTAFHWRADFGPRLVVYLSSLISTLID